jgi:hypothetical protein
MVAEEGFAVLLNQIITNTCYQLQQINGIIIIVRRRLKRLRKKLGIKTTPSNRHIQKRKKKRQERGLDWVWNLDDYELYESTSLFRPMFNTLCNIAIEYSEHKIVNSMTIPSMVYLCLYWLKEYPSYSTIGKIFRISKPTASRIIHNLLPLLASKASDIIWPNSPNIHSFEGVSGAIDCTSHFRNRIHPGSTLLYRSDKRGHFLTCQAVCSLSGEIWRVDISFGHNNDQGVFNLSGLREELEKTNIKLLADGGYSHINLITPINGRDDYNAELSGKRSVVETVFARVKFFKAATYQFHHNIILQLYSLLLAYKLTNLKIKASPIRITQE